MMEIAEINVLAISPPGQWKRTPTPQYPLNMVLGPDASLDNLEKKIICFPCPKIEPWFHSCPDGVAKYVPPSCPGWN
jgi:hypothetical protein